MAVKYGTAQDAYDEGHRDAKRRFDVLLKDAQQRVADYQERLAELESMLHRCSARLALRDGDDLKLAIEIDRLLDRTG